MFGIKGSRIRVRPPCRKILVFSIIVACFLFFVLFLRDLNNQIPYVALSIYGRDNSINNFGSVNRTDNSKISVQDLDISEQTTTTHLRKTYERNRVNKFPLERIYQNVSLVSDSFRANHLMTVTGNGRLGNKLFQVASLVGVAAMHGYTPFINDLALRNIFDMDIAGSRNTVGYAVYSERHGAGIYDNIVEKIDLNRNATLNGYFQSWKYFAHIEDDIRQLFRFKGPTTKKVTSLLNELDSEDNTLIGVHIRRGDMNTKRELSRGYNVAPKEYLLKATNYFKSRYDKVQFLVVSDDMKWSKQTLQGKEFNFVSSRVAHEDLAILARAHHTIVTSGTFGWWGGFLAGGEVVYYSNYPKKGSWLDTVYRREDYYPPHWVPME